MWKWIVAALFVLHGIAHGPGVAGELFGAEMEGVGGPTFDVGGAETAFATLLLLGGLAFVAAGLGVVLEKAWWRPLALAAAVISMLPVVVWWDSASTGAVLNALAVAAVLLAPRVPGLSPRRPPAATA